MYNENILETFVNSDNIGDLKGATVTSTLKSKKYGDTIKLSLKINENGIVTDAKYKFFGGILLSVVTSTVCDLIKEKSILNAQRLNVKDVAKVIGKLPQEKEYVVSFVLIVLQETVKKYIKKVDRINKQLKEKNK